MADKDRTDIKVEQPGAEPGIVVDAPDGQTPVGQMPDGETPEQRARREARRRVLAGGLASAPLILTLASRPAMATWSGGGQTGGTCGYAGLLSGNASQVSTSSTFCKGKPPKYWKTREDDCKRHFGSGPCNPIYIDYSEKDYSVPSKYELTKYKRQLERNWYYNWYKIQECNNYLYMLDRYPSQDSPPFGTRFSEVFGSGIASNSKLTIMQALWLDEESPHPPSGNDGPSPLLAHCAAAYCNASEYGENSFGLSPWDVVNLVRREIGIDPWGLEEKLRFMNDQG